MSLAVPERPDKEEIMRKFSSYGPVDKDMHYYVPREELVEKVCRRIVGENFDKGGHYITVWAPRQCGKTWVMREVLWRLLEDDRFDIIKLNIENLKTDSDPDSVAGFLSKEISEALKTEKVVSNLKEFETMFSSDVLKKPLILIIDEFDALDEHIIAGVAGIFRNIYLKRAEDKNPSPRKKYHLHGVALIGVRSVLGVENVKGPPFNVQRSVHIPKLTFDEVHAMFKWYEKESGQEVENDVIDRVFHETRGQPGLVSWLGELLTEGYDFHQPDPTRAIRLNDFEDVYADAINVLPNNNIINIISKARQEPYKSLVLELFKTHEKHPFKFDDSRLNFLYMNGVTDIEKTGRETGIRFSCPFVQKRLFNYFSNELFHYMGPIFDIAESVADIFEADGLNITSLVRRYERHLRRNRDWLLEDAPRRKDLRVFEAVYHFGLYEYLNKFLANKKATVWPEFPTGNGKVDLLIRYREKLYAIEIKSFTDEGDFREALGQAARYAKSLDLDRIHLVVFVERIPDELREKYEDKYTDKKTGVTVSPVFAATG